VRSASRARRLCGGDLVVQHLVDNLTAHPGRLGVAFRRCVIKLFVVGGNEGNRHTEPTTMPGLGRHVAGGRV